MTGIPITQNLRILIVEDHELARFGLSMALAERADVTVVGEAQNGEEGVRLALAEQPDIVLMDIGMPVMDGITATQQIKAQLPQAKVVILTSISNSEEVMASLAAGADAYCMKDIKIDRLRQVLEMVMDGALWLDPAIARLVVQSLPNNPTASAQPASTVPETMHQEPTAHPKRRYNTELTEREHEVLQLIVEGKSNKEIAVALKVSSHTAKAHVANIIQKLAVDDRTQVAVKALKGGLV
jgi:DNA-binding NarL/FixJ family response regulator